MGRCTRWAVASLCGAVLLLGAGCSSGGDQVATGPDGRPLVTTPPLTVPPDLDPSATTGPVEMPSATATAAAPTPPTATAKAPTAAGASSPTPEAPAAEEDGTAVPEPTTLPVVTALPSTTDDSATANATPPDGNTPADVSETETAETPSPPEPLVGPDGVIRLGDFDVVNLITGATQNIAELAPAGPTLLWFWTPSCETCLFEAPTIVQFARDNPQITVVGVGAGTAANGDSVDGARAFVERFGAAEAGMTMLYDVSFRAWRQFGVTNQPWVVLFDRNGNMIFTQQGRVDLAGAAEAMGV